MPVATPPKTILLLDYRNRGGAAVASGNLGDHIQSIAMMRLVVKWLAIWNRVRQAKREAPVPVSVGTCPRDEEREIHQEALLILYGWHMHKNAKGRYSFPPKGGAALALSFHISHEDMLTSDAVNYLRSIGPIGCRDLSTLRKLRARNVPSFYTGCVTLTLPSAPAEKRKTGCVAVDTVAPPDSSAALLSMWSQSNRYLTQGQMWTRAICILRLLRRSSLVLSSRLHVLYPCIAMGTKAIIQSPNGDKRDDWGAPGRWETARLYATGAKDYRADAQRLERALAAALGRILAGEAVATAWRRAVLIHVAFCFDSAFAIPTLACANSLLCHNGERPLMLHFFHLNVLPCDVATMRARLLARHPGVMVEFHECDPESVSQGYSTHLPHVSAQTMQRLWLHEKLPYVDRLIYIDGDMIIRGSLDELFDLRVPVLAARNSIENIMLSANWNRGMGYSGNSCFNAGLMILNLATLRRLNFSKFVRSVLAQCSCNDQTILNLYCQGHHTQLKSTYNYFAREPMDISSGVDPIVIHFCGSRKPWKTGGDTVHMGSEWHKYRL